MNLLSLKKVGKEKALEDEKKRVTSLRLKREKFEEIARLADLELEPMKKKKWDEYTVWNQAMQTRKAELLQEIEKLELQRDRLADNLKLYVN